MKVPIDRIVSSGVRIRALGDTHALAESIHESGLLNPITVTPDMRLIAGAHRLEACKQLGWDEIEVHVLALDDLHAELAEIDENLIRAELTTLERAEHLSRRKAIYEELHPETRTVNAKGGPGRGKTNEIISPVSPPTFAADAAAKTGVSERTIQQEVKIARSITPEVRDALRDTPLADKKVALMGIAAMPEAEQRTVVEVLRAPPTSPLRTAINNSSVSVPQAVAIQKDAALRKSVESGETTVAQAAAVVDLIREQKQQHDAETGASANHKMTRLMTAITDITQAEWDAVHNSVFNRELGGTFRQQWITAAAHMMRLAEDRTYTITQEAVKTIDALN